MAQYIGNSPETILLKTKRDTYTYTATANQTVFSGADNNTKTFTSLSRSQVLVYLDGSLVEPNSYTVTPTSVILDTPVASGVQVVIFTEVESALVSSPTLQDVTNEITAVTNSLSYELDDLTDVDISTVAPTDGQALVWDNTNSVWVAGDSFSQSDFDTAFTAKDTDDLSEGSTNLYYTDARVGSYLTSNSYVTESYVDTALSSLIDSAPTTLDTLNELAAALGDDANFATTITTSIATKLATADFTSTADTWIATKDTDALSEGSTNLYYTDARARSALSAAGDLSYNSTTGEFSVTTYKTSDFSTDFATKDTGDLAEGTNLYYTDARVSSYLTTNNYATESFVGTSVSTAISNLVDTAPTTLDTLNELAAALGDDPNFATTVTTSIGTKLATADFSTTADTWLSGKSTSDVTEGTNLYYTDARVGSYLTANNYATSGDLPTALTDLGITDGTAGQVLTTDGSGTFTFEDGATPTTVSGTAPTNPEQGDLWFDNVNTGQLYTYVDTTWISTAGLTTLEYSSVGDLSDVDITTAAPTDGQALIWDNANSKFVPGDSFSQSDFDTAFTAKDTDDLSEGSTNLYYTDARVGTYLSTNGYDTAANIVASITDSAPATLDTLNELAAALGDDANFASTVTTSIGTKLATADFTSTADTWIGTKDTDDLSEGSTNLYYTDARARSAISATGDVSYDSGTGVISFTQSAEVNDLTAAVTWANVPDANITQSSVTQHQAALSITESQISDLQSYLTSETTTSLAFVGTTLTFTDETGTPNNIDLSSLLDDTNTITSVNSQTGAVVLDTDDISEGTTNIYYTDARAQAAITGGTGVTVTSGSVAIGQDVSTTANVTFANFTATGDVQIDGDLTVSGTTVTINATNLALQDNMIYLNEGSTVANPDLGIAGNYNDGTYAHAGMFRDASDGVWKFYDSYIPEPDASAFIDTTHATFNLASVQAGSFIGDVTGNLTGDVTGTVSSLSNHTLTDLGITDGTTGQVLTTDGSGTFTFEDAGSSVVVSGTAPVSPAEGDMWFDSVTTGQLYVYIGSTWVSTAGLTTLEYSSVGDLSDVDITTAAPTDGQALVWDNANSKFVPGDVAVDFTGYATESYVTTAISTSSSNYATAAQGALADSALQSSDLTGYATESYVTTAISGKADTSSLANVATSGDYDDLINTPTMYADSDVAAYLSSNGFDTATNIIASITDAAPTTLDTLNELAAALGDDANFSTTVTNSIASKLATADFTSTADTWLSTKDTDDLAEGTNLYYTDARVGSYLTTNSYATESYVTTAISGKADTSSLATVATSGDYDDLINPPSIPSALTDLSITDGTIGQVLKTDGAGNFAFADAASGVAVSGTAPTSPNEGDLWYDDTTTGQLFVYENGSWTATGIPPTLGSVGDLGDVDTTTTAPNDGQALIWDSASDTWVPGDSFSQSDFNTAFGAKSTSDLSEGTNLYYTDARVGTYLTANNYTTTADLPTSITDLSITDGTVGQVLTTDGAGTFTFEDAAEGGASVVVSGTAPTSPNEGDLWFDNVTTGELHVYESGAWLSTAVPVVIESIDELGDVDITTTAPTDGQALIWDNANSKFVPGDSFSQSDFNTAFGAKSTSDLSEGTNLYYTDARVGTYLSSNGFDTATNIIASITDAAPATLDTLNELAAALGDDANFSATVTTALGNKADTSSLATVATSGDYDDLINTPSIPADISDLTDTGGLLTHFSGSYDDLTDKPTIPTSLTGLGITDGTTGQVLTTDGAGNFTFEDAAEGGGGASITTSETAPVSPAEGDMWFNSSDLGLYMYYNDGDSTQWIQINDAGGSSGDTPWVEASTTYNALVGSKVFVDSSGGAVSVVLPESPSMGDEVYVVDASGTAGTHNITISRNGKKITGLDEDLILDVDDSAVVLAYYNAARGWIVISK